MITDDTDDLLGRSNALNFLGQEAQAKGDLDAAGRYFEESLALATELRDGARKADRLSNLGLLHAQAGRIPEAKEALHSARDIYRSMGEGVREAGCLCNLSELALEWAQFDEAEKLLREARRLLEEAGDRSGLAYALVNLVETLIGRAQLEEAERLARLGLATCEEQNLPQLVPALLESRARLRIPQAISHDSDEAYEALSAAESIRTELALPRSGREAAHVDSLMTVLDSERLAAVRLKIEKGWRIPT